MRSILAAYEHHVHPDDSDPVGLLRFACAGAIAVQEPSRVPGMRIMNNHSTGTNYDHLFMDQIAIVITVDFVLPGDYEACSIASTSSWSFEACLLTNFEPINVHY